jgi:hypothetical protein
MGWSQSTEVTPPSVPFRNPTFTSIHFPCSDLRSHGNVLLGTGDIHKLRHGTEDTPVKLKSQGEPESFWNETILMPRKTTPPIAIISGLVALIVAAAGLTSHLNGAIWLFIDAISGHLNKGVIWLFCGYAITGFFGGVSLVLGLLIARRRSRTLTSLRLEWLHVQDNKSEGPVSNEARQAIIAQRDALVRSGDLTDADRATKLLSSLVVAESYSSGEESGSK